METVVRISGSGSSESTSDSATATSNAAAAGGSKGASSSDNGTGTPKQLPEVELGVDRIIDSQDNEFVLSAPKENVASLTLDPQLIQDLTFLFASAAVSSYLLLPVTYENLYNFV